MIEISRRQPADNLLPLASSDRQLRAVVIVLDQLDRRDELEPQLLFAALSSEDATLRQTAAEVLSKQADWAAESKQQLNAIWSRMDDSDRAAGETLSRIIAGWKNERPVQELVARWISTAADSNHVQQSFLASHLSDFSAATMPVSWSASIANWLPQADPQMQRELADSLRQIKLESSDATMLAETLVQLAERADAADQRLRLLSALPTNHVLGAAVEEQVVSAFLDDDESLVPLAANVLLRIRLSRAAANRLGYIGKDVGPELTRIGSSRTAAALMEALLFPSARLEQSYQSTRVLTVDGQIYNGLIKRRTGDSIELQLNAQRQVAIASDDIERLEPSDVSVMPSGLAELLTMDEISDLMALLRSAK